MGPLHFFDNLFFGLCLACFFQWHHIYWIRNSIQFLHFKFLHGPGHWFCCLYESSCEISSTFRIYTGCFTPEVAFVCGWVVTLLHFLFGFASVHTGIISSKLKSITAAHLWSFAIILQAMRQCSLCLLVTSCMCYCIVNARGMNKYFCEGNTDGSL